MSGKWRPVVFGKKIIVDINMRRGYRLSPPPGPRARAIAKCARGQDLKTRKECFATGGR